MNNNGLFTEVDFMRTLPDTLKSDTEMTALGQAIAGELHKLSNETGVAKIFTRIDELPEDVLDCIARDFKIDWYDFSYPIETKRALIKDSWNVHRHLGTKAAVETAMSAIYADTKALEWFEYGADPYHFKLLVDATYQDVDPAKHQRVLDRVIYYQNLRSHLDGVEYVAIPDGYCRNYGVAAAAGMALEITVEVAVYGLE